MDVNAALMCPVAGFLVEGLEQLAVHIIGEEHIVLVAHVVGPGDAVDLVACRKDLIKARKVEVQIRIEHIHDPVGLLVHGDKQRFRADHP